jgi:GT2 family glycosyltransferase
MTAVSARCPHAARGLTLTRMSAARGEDLGAGRLSQSSRLRYLARRAGRALLRRPWALVRSPRELRRWLRRAAAEAYTAPLEAQYQRWLGRRSLTPERVRSMEEACARLGYRPLVSIVTPVYNTPERWLRAAIESVRAQIYPDWQLCLADDASTEPHVRRVLDEYAGIDERIVATTLTRNSGISGASNAALSLASGEFVGMLDHDDELRPEALFEVVRLLNAQPDVDIIYSDEDKVDEKGARSRPFFKPDWSPNLLLSCNYIAHLLVYRRSLLEETGGFRSAFDGSQDYDLILRASEMTTRIAHLPLQLYSWRMIKGSAAASERAKPYAYVAAARALEETMVRRGVPGRVEDTEAPGIYRIRPKAPQGALVSVIIPTRDKAGLLRRCLGSLSSVTNWVDYEVIVVDSAPDEPLPDSLRPLVKALVPYEGDGFNFSRAINLGAKRASGHYLLLLNDDTEAREEGWLQAMLEQAQRADVGVVGARLVDGHGDPQHEGIVLGLWGCPAANVPFRHWSLGECLRDCSAVTAACMMTRREVFEQLGGFDEGMWLGWNDVDYCLRARQAGYAVVYTREAVLRHDEGSTRGTTPHPEDDAFFKERWGTPEDPFYNANFDRERGPFVLGD